MILRIMAIFLFGISYAQSYSDAYDLLKTDFLQDFDKDSVYRTINDNKKFAISSYIALKTTSFLLYNSKIEDASQFLNLVDERALLKEDMPYYLYIRYSLTKNSNDLKNLVLNFPDSYYGYKLFIENLDTFGEDEKVQIIENLVRKRMRERATFLIFTLSNIDGINYIQLLLSGSGSEKLKIFSRISESSKYYIRALRHIAMDNKEYEKIYLDKIAATKQEYEEAILNFCERSFYKGEDISGYIQLIEEDSKYYPQIKWFEFLYLYKNQKYNQAIELLMEQGKNYEPDTLNYWLYLINKKLGNTEQAQAYLSKIQNTAITDVSKLSYYRALVDYISGKRYKFHFEKITPYRDSMVESIRAIKEKDYKMGYTEGLYLSKNGYCKEVFSVIPEVGVRCFDRNSLSTYIKPFGHIEYNENLVYSIIRQESFFDPYAISSSNAVGITQFIPKTALSYSKRLNIDNFDMTHLFNPDLAIKFSVEYLKYLEKIWNGNIVYMIASYNAGENAVKKFLENSKVDDPGEFIEFFPYRETRDYVKKVLRNYIIYSSLE